MKFIIPDEALVQHLAITGKAGSGKTNAAKVMVERFLNEKRRVCIIDPTGAWWGLQSNEAGKRAAFKVTIFGGAHGHFPLTDKHGALLGELVATTDMPCILDTSEMGANERTRFMADFAETLYKRNVSNPLHLIIDECHEFTPQMPRTPQAGIMLNAVERMVTGGRVRGFRVMLISQRPAAVNKSVLTQVETMIVFRMTGAPDRHAVQDWVVANADKRTGADILTSLASLPTGEGWVWSPENGILERFKFPKSSTYDSGRAPTGEQHQVVLAKIDHSEIEQRLAVVSREVEESDPKRLKARIAELEKGKGKPDATALQEAREAGRAEGLAQGRAEAEQTFKAWRTATGDRLRDLAADLEVGATTGVEIKVAHAPDAASMAQTMKRNPSFAAPLPSPKAASAPVDGVTGPQQRILNALAKLESLGVEQMKKGQVAAFADTSPTSSAFANNLGRLRTMGLIEYPRGGEVVLTTAGVKASAYPDAPLTVQDLQEAWLRLLTGPQARIVECLISAYPDRVQKDSLAEQAGASATSSAFANNLGALRSLGVVEYPERGFVAATKLLFPV